MFNPRQITKVVIPAAGKGTRLLPLTKAIPKELVPLGTKPVLEHIVDECAQCGLTEVLFIISEEKTAIRSHFGDSANGVRFYYAIQPEQNGLADAIGCARDFIGDSPFAVALGDSVITTDQPVLPFCRVLETYERTDAAGVIVVQKAPLSEISRYGVVKPAGKIGPSFRIDGLVEKPKPEEAPSNYAVAGRYAFDAVLFDYIVRTPRGAVGEYQISDSIDLMLRDSREVWCVALGDSEIRRDIGTFETYFEALEAEIARLRHAR